MKRLLPSYPLFLNDPFFNIWINSEQISETNPSYFNGREIPIYGFIKYGNKLYRFLGNEYGEKMEVVDIKLTAMTTTFILKCDLFKITLNFLSPLPLDNLDLLSMPTCFLDYSVETKEKDYEVILSISSKILSNSKENDYIVRGDEIIDQEYESAYFGKYKQDILSLASDNYTCEHGYYYLTGDKAYCSLKSDFLNIINGEKRENPISSDEHFITAINKSNNNKFIIAFDDVTSIYYFGDILRGYYFRNGKTIMDAIDESYKNYDFIKNEMDKFDKRFDELTSLTDEYHLIALASYRQSVAGHKLVRDKKGRTLFLSKEMTSGGCIATVDVTFPSLPLMLLYNPSLIRGMLYPIFDFASMKVWPYKYAPHDVGVYPYVIGQYYSTLWKDEDPSKRTLGYMNSEAFGTLPPYYLYKDGNKVYSEKRQMPYEECSNMIICSYLEALYTKDYSLIKDNYNLLKNWADYLIDSGMIPSNQLCSDDFAGHQDKNLNLSIKSIVALNDFYKLSKLIGIDDKKYKEEAALRAKTIEDSYKTYLPLTFDNEENSYSLKYNLGIDLVDNNPIFSKELRKREINEYLNRINHFSVPLDTREKYTKSDWICWSAAITNDLNKQNELYKGIYNFLKESPVRVPFSDWFNTETGEIYLFRNRTVQAGIFMPVLIKQNKISGGITHEEN